MEVESKPSIDDSAQFRQNISPARQEVVHTRTQIEPSHVVISFVLHHALRRAHDTAT